MTTPIFDNVNRNVTTDAEGNPTLAPSPKVAAAAITGGVLTVIVAMLGAITPDLLAPLGAWANVAFVGIGALAATLGAYIKSPRG